MTVPATFTRRSARVEAIRLDNAADLHDAAEWARAHGLSAHPGNSGTVLHLWVPGGDYLTAGLGQWVTYEPDTGGVTVWPDDKFRIEHPQDDEGDERG